MVAKSRNMGNNACIVIAFKDSRPIARIMTLDHWVKWSIHGGSDATFNNLDTAPMLFGRAIQGAKDTEMKESDLGRSGLDNRGPITFKEY